VLDKRMRSSKGPLNHERLKALSKQLGRPLFTLYALSVANDPFIAGQPARRAAAEWFAEVWNDLGVERGFHLRRIHYAAMSQDPPILMPDGEPYINTDECADFLNHAALDARHLGLVDAEDLVDRKNAEPAIYFADGDDVPASIECTTGGLMGGSTMIQPPVLSFPHLQLSRPIITQPFHVEVWCEKSTMNDILMPLGESYGVNVTTGTGELSLTRCLQLVRRAKESGKPVRILYVSDFDPAGASMPVAVARKIEHLLHVRDLQLDIQLRPVVLTHEQCLRYRLPRTPIKASEGRARGFEARFGEGATELDALEALHRGELRRILVREIGRYHDDALEDEVEAVTAQVRADLADVERTVRARHADDLAKLEAERVKIAAEIEEMAKRAVKMELTLKRKARPILRKIEKEFEAEAPDVDDYDWPEPDHGDEDDDPLFDSTRGYVEQIDRYKAHQGKPTEAEPRKKPQPFSVVCANTACGKTFTATRRDAPTCCGACREKLRRLEAAPPPIACAFCGKPFNSIRGAVTCSDSCRKRLRWRREHADE
jgi:hypothetical protein